jgi:hypothetical protein
MFDSLTVQSLAEERIRDALREAEKARKIQQIGQSRKPQGWWAAAASFFKRPPILAARQTSDCLPVGCR